MKVFMVNFFFLANFLNKISNQKLIETKKVFLAIYKIKVNI